MSAKSWQRQLGRAKEKACGILTTAGYKIEKANNQTYCVTAMRDTEWRVIAIGIREIVCVPWFQNQVRNMERLPVPDSRIIQREIWIKDESEQHFNMMFWRQGRWEDENRDPVDTFKPVARR